MGGAREKHKEVGALEAKARGRSGSGDEAQSEDSWNRLEASGGQDAGAGTGGPWRYGFHIHRAVQRRLNPGDDLVIGQSSNKSTSQAMRFAIR